MVLRAIASLEASPGAAFFELQQVLEEVWRQHLMYRQGRVMYRQGRVGAELVGRAAAGDPEAALAYSLEKAFESRLLRRARSGRQTVSPRHGASALQTAFDPARVFLGLRRSGFEREADDRGAAVRLTPRRKAAAAGLGT
jgi:hypothetical protein